MTALRETMTRRATGARREPIIDCDIHNELAPGSLDPFLSTQWRRHRETYGSRTHTGSLYPKGAPHAARTDAWPPSGLVPGADLGFMQQQHLDPMKVEYGILNCLSPASTQLDPDYAAALCAATNDWQQAEWFERDGRLRGGIVVPVEDAALAASEIDRVAGRPGFVQVLLVCRTAAPLGHRRYWPIYEAAERHGLPVGIHFGGGSRGVPITAAGWPSYYIEDHTSMSQAFQAHVASFVLSGVFDRFPGLRVVLIEGGFAWLPALTWRLDRHVARLQGDLPRLQRRPSAYVAEHLWVTTQPMEEPRRPRDLETIFSHLGGVDRVMFSTDYPHWDFDDPARAFPVKLPAQLRRQVLTENARALYRLPAASVAEADGRSPSHGH